MWVTLSPRGRLGGGEPLLYLKPEIRLALYHRVTGVSIHAKIPINGPYRKLSASLQPVLLT